MKKWFQKHRLDIFYNCFIISLFIAVGINENETVPVETTEISQDIIRWKIEEVSAIEITEETVETVEKVTFYDVPLSEDLQLHIFEECEKYNIAPAIIIAMIEKESSFDASAIGDGGDSYGLMQLQPQWTEIQEIMDEVGCTDLLDPFQNVSVGIRWVAQIRDTNSDVYWVLMRYNGGTGHANEGCATGNYSDYAIEIVQRASEIEQAAQND